MVYIPGREDPTEQKDYGVATSMLAGLGSGIF